jgi:cytochrome c
MPMPRLDYFIRAISLVAGVTTFSVEPAYADAALIARGYALAKNRCGRCHAIGKTGESTNPKSPPFRYLSRRYPLSDLEEALAEGIIVGHEGPEMPNLQFSPPMIAALMACMDRCNLNGGRASIRKAVAPWCWPFVD